MRGLRAGAMACILVCLFLLPCRAADAAQSPAEAAWPQFLDGLPQPMREAAGKDPAGALENARRAWSLGAWLEKTGEALHAAWPQSAALLARLGALLLLCALIARIESCAPLGETASVCQLCTAMAVCLAMSDLLGPLLDGCAAYLTFLSELSGAVTPLAAAVTAAGGQLTLGAVLSASLSLLYALFENLNAWLLLPVVRVGFVWGVLAALSPDLRAEGVAQWIRQLFTWAITALAVFCGFVISVQSVIARSADSLSVRTVRFALANSIPLIGGAISDALTTATGALRVIRSACGAWSMAAVLAAILPLLVRLLLTRFVLGVAEAASSLLGVERAGRILGEFGACVGCMLAMTALSSLLMILVLALLCGLGGGG